MEAVGIVLAAGLSSRMGRLKGLLPLGEELVLQHQIRVLLEGGVQRVVLVTGHCREEMEKGAAGTGAECVFNPRYGDGMFSSVLAGLRAAGACDCIVLLPVDCPLIGASGVAKLLTEFRRMAPAVLYPAYQGKKGHPPVIDKICCPGIFSHDGTMGLKGALEQWDSRSALLEMGEPGVTMDMDTPEDYQRILKLLQKENPELQKP